MNAIEYGQTCEQYEHMISESTFVSFLDKVERTGMTSSGIEVDAVIEVCVTGNVYFNECDAAWVIDGLSITDEDGEEIADDQEYRAFAAKVLKAHFEKEGL